MVQVARVVLVTPLWGFPGEIQPSDSLPEALVERGLRVVLAGPGREGLRFEPIPGLQIVQVPLPEPQDPFAARLPLRLRGAIQELARGFHPEVVHYARVRWAALGVPEGVPATGWLADQEGSLCPATPFGLRRTGPGWFRRWRRARKARALQIAALDRLAGLAVPEAAVGEAAARTQLRGMPLVHLLPDPDREPRRHAAGLLRLWAELPV